MKIRIAAIPLLISILPSILAAQSGEFDGVWTGIDIENNSSLECDGETQIVVLVNGSSIKGTGFEQEALSSDEDPQVVSGILSGDGTISEGTYSDGMEDIGTFTGTFTGDTAQITSEDPSLEGCSSNLTLTRQVSFTYDYDELWSGSLGLTAGDCEDAIGSELMLAKIGTSGGAIFTGSIETAIGLVFLVRIYTDPNGVISEGTYGTEETPLGTFSGATGSDSGQGTWSQDDCTGTFEIAKIATAPGPDGEEDDTVVDTIATRTTLELVTTSDGSTTTARFGAGASADNGATTASSFAANAAITIGGSVTPQAADVGEAGEIFVVLYTDTALTYLDVDGVYINWNGGLKTIQPAYEVSALDSVETFEVFTGNVQSGLYRVFLGYRLASGGPLHFNAKAFRLTVN